MSLRVTKAGLFDTIQDGGRWGHQHLGINPGGWMDTYSAQLANALLGKELFSANFEVTFPAASILFEKATIICITGAHFSPTINGKNISLNQPVFLPANSLLQFTRRIGGQWCYLSILQDVQAENWLSSYSTNTKIGAGGYKGRALQKEDRLLFKTQFYFNANSANVVKELPWRESHPLKWSSKLIPFTQGNEWHWLVQEAKTNMETSYFTITNQSDRMGYRLSGRDISIQTEMQLVSSPVCAGTMQRLPTGQLIVLMADHQTAGGYPRVGYITWVGRCRLSQCSPGQFVTFEKVDLAEAEQQQMKLKKYLVDLKNACSLKMQNILHALL